MGAWSKESKSHVANMAEGDFYGSEKSMTVDGATDMRIEFVDAAGNVYGAVVSAGGAMIKSSRR